MSSSARAVANGRRADPTSMRINNMGLILRALRDNGGRSRAQLATETGLSKATTSTLIAELVERRLVSEGEPELTRSVGRPGLRVELSGGGVAGIGVEINVDYLCVVAVDLSGRIIREVIQAIDTPAQPVENVIAGIASRIDECVASLASSGTTPVGATIGAPGFTDTDQGVVKGAPNLGWHDVELAAEVSERLTVAKIPVRVENDAKLGAVAEYAEARSDGVHDVLYVTGDIGVGGGIITGGELFRGVSGFSGEIGHMPLDPRGLPCPCGRTGCWERWVGLTGLLDLVAPDDDVVHDPAVPLPDRLREIKRRIAAGDERAVAAVDSIIEGLSLGLSILADVLNPARIVLGGYFAWFEDELVRPVCANVQASRLNTFGEVIAVRASRLGLTAAARGGAHSALARVFDNPTIVAKP